MGGDDGDMYVGLCDCMYCRGIGEQPESTADVYTSWGRLHGRPERKYD